MKVTENYIVAEEVPCHNLSIKLVIPGGCDFKCPFCFNKMNTETRVTGREGFMQNFMKSLKEVAKAARKYNPSRRISLDITGNEPTLDIGLLRYVLKKVGENRSIFNSVVLTSNGYNLGILNDTGRMRKVVDIVNISVHHYKTEERFKAFGRGTVALLDEHYLDIMEALDCLEIKKTAVAVLYKPLEEGFRDFIVNFVEWCKYVGFDDIRIRSNFYSDDDFFTRYINDDMFVGEIESKAGLVTKTFEVNGMQITMMKGVESLVPYVVGVEVVVDDDGMPYIDYGKKYPFNEEYIKHVYINP